MCRYVRIKRGKLFGLHANHGLPGSCAASLEPKRQSKVTSIHPSSMLST